METRTLYLIRHGQYDRTDTDELGGSLTENGREQALLTGRALTGLSVNRIYCSDMHRAVETAYLIADILNAPMPQTDPLLRESVPTVPPQLLDYFTELDHNADSSFKLTDVEGQRTRSEEAFAKYFVPTTRPGINDLIVCHGNLIRFLACRALDIDPDKWANMRINHCGITRIAIKANGTMQLISHNETGHIHFDMRTDL